ncbi:hypothetical protein HPB51_011664 [Rhipicephalus microplus]|uniref:Uncharacterized protein n=1 Tax=Rhipicephalus microplus TaxID=6941 RepID=A0A9J6ESN3_RHIMP|nr:hypothetical protein HPB51_011664 [Rhipicephalus microplus]
MEQLATKPIDDITGHMAGVTATKPLCRCRQFGARHRKPHHDRPASDFAECNDSARSSCGLNLLLTAAALVDEAKETHCPSATNLLLTPAAVDGHGANSDATQAGLGSSQGNMHLQVPNVTHCQLVQQLVQQPFHGDPYEDVDDWLDDYNRCASVDEWNEQ